MGLSGSGKSSLLRCINRLNRPTSGEILINGEDIAGVPEERLRSLRRKELAMVFQHFGLLPHYTVLQNIAFGLELQGVEKRECELKAAESMRLVGLDGYADLMVSELSGACSNEWTGTCSGQRSGSPADGRGLLSAGPADTGTDAGRAAGLQSKMKKTIVFITHDLEEAIKLGDRIAIMRDGEIQANRHFRGDSDTPANEYVRCFVENVDRSRIVTAASIMVDKPMVARLGKEGPEVLTRKMRERKTTVLPVVDPGWYTGR